MTAAAPPRRKPAAPRPAPRADGDAAAVETVPGFPVLDDADTAPDVPVLDHPEPSPAMPNADGPPGAGPDDVSGGGPADRSAFGDVDPAEDRLVALGARFVGRERSRALLAVGDQAVVSAANFATSVLVGWAAGKAGLGVYGLAVSLILFVRGVQEQIVYGPYLVFCHSRKGRRLARYAGSVLAHEGIWLAATAAGLAGLAVYLNLGGEPSGLNDSGWVMVWAVPLTLFREFARHIAFGHFRTGTAVLLDVAVAVLQVGGLGALYWAGMLTVPATLGVMGAACALVCWPWAARFLRGVTFRPKAVAVHWRRNWRFGRWALATHLLHGASHYLMPWVVALVDGEDATGLFMAGSTLVGIANMFVLGLAHYICPKAAEAFGARGVPGLRRVLRAAALVFSAVLAPFALVCGLFGDAIATLVFPDEFAGAGLVLAVLAVNMWANALSITCGNGLWAVHRPDANFTADLVSLGVVAVCTAALIPPFGVVGAAAAMAIGGWADVFARYIALRRVLRDLPADGRAAA